MQISATNAANSTDQTGQDSGSGAVQGAGNAPGPPPSGAGPSDRFAADALTFLTALQEAASTTDAATTSSTSATSLDAIGSADQTLAKLVDALQQLTQSREGSSSQTASASAAALTGSAAAGSLALSSILTRALDQLGLALDSLNAGPGGAHGHHHHHGGGKMSSAPISTASAISLTASASMIRSGDETTSADSAG